MKITNQKIINDLPKLQAISKKTLPVKVSYAIAKNIIKLDGELEAYSKERARLIEMYAEKGTDGNAKVSGGQLVIKKDYIEKWNENMLELLSIENEIDVHKFSIAELDGYEMTADELMAIEYMIED